MSKISIKRKDGMPIEWEQVQGFSRYLVSTDGQVYNIEHEKVIKENLNSAGYLRVLLYNDENEQKQVLVHRLVYLAHGGAIPKGMQINHMDEDKTNNQIQNLEIVTPQQNVLYGTANERRKASVKKSWLQRRKVAVC
jgi:NUMOD4 motif.